jgi:amino acid transporter
LLSGNFTKAADVQNTIVTIIKFIPLAFAGVVGFVLVGKGQVHFNYTTTDEPTFLQLNPILGMLGSVPAALFVIDGFYAACGAQSEMKEPRKFSLALITGVLLTSALILLVSMALLFGSADGTVGGLFNSGA